MKANKNKNTGKIFGITIAIFVIVGLATGYYLNEKSKTSTTSELGTYSDPKIALEETQKALSMLSANVNKGYKSVEYIQEYENTKNIIFNLD